jgi:TonB family protein
MISQQRVTKPQVAFLIAALAFMATPFGFTTGWTAGHEPGGMRPTAQTGAMQRETTTGASSPATTLLARSPNTADEYAAYVRDRLQVAAMQLKQEGNAELKLTISKDGSIRDTEVVDLRGAPTLRDQLAQLVNRIKPLPPLPGNIDALVVTTDVAFDYPGENLFDHYGWLPRSPG